MMERGAFRRAEVRALYGVSYRIIDQKVESGAIAHRKVGGFLLLNPRDVEREFGFSEVPIEPSAESLAEMADFGQ